MQREATRILHTLAIAIALAAVAPAAATAGRWGPGTRAGEQPAEVHMALGTCHQYCEPALSSRLAAKRPARPAPTALRPRVITFKAGTGFNWNDAAIGFGSACGLALVTFGAFAYRRHGAVHEIREPA
jgi:hypothetical protein